MTDSRETVGGMNVDPVNVGQEPNPLDDMEQYFNPHSQEYSHLTLNDEVTTSSTNGDVPITTENSVSTDPAEDVEVASRDVADDDFENGEPLDDGILRGCFDAGPETSSAASSFNSSGPALEGLESSLRCSVETDTGGDFIDTDFERREGGRGFVISDYEFFRRSNENLEDGDSSEFDEEENPRRQSAIGNSGVASDFLSVPGTSPNLQPAPVARSSERRDGDRDCAAQLPSSTARRSSRTPSPRRRVASPRGPPSAAFVLNDLETEDEVFASSESDSRRRAKSSDLDSFDADHSVLTSPSPLPENYHEGWSNFGARASTPTSATRFVASDDEYFLLVSDEAPLPPPLEVPPAPEKVPAAPVNMATRIVWVQSEAETERREGNWRDGEKSEDERRDADGRWMPADDPTYFSDDEDFRSGDAPGNDLNAGGWDRNFDGETDGFEAGHQDDDFNDYVEVLFPGSPSTATPNLSLNVREEGAAGGADSKLAPGLEWPSDSYVDDNLEENLVSPCAEQLDLDAFKFGEDQKHGRADSLLPLKRRSYSEEHIYEDVTQTMKNFISHFASSASAFETKEKILKGFPEIDKSVGFPKVMLWTEYEAYVLQVKQIGISACGPTAVLNILRYFDISVSKTAINEAIPVNKRREASPLPKYLFSRSVAGSSADDIIRGVTSLSGGSVVGRFFPFFPARRVNLAAWLESWMREGAVPAMTLNLQKGVPFGCQVPDAWHHQMVYGVDAKGVYLTNPLEIVSFETILSQLTSDRTLLVRSKDVIKRWNSSTDLSPLLRGPDDASEEDRRRWRIMNVLGQVVNVMREHFHTVKFCGGAANPAVSPSWPCPCSCPCAAAVVATTTTTHVEIPAMYRSGVTIFVTKDSKAHAMLNSSPELEILE